MAHMKKSIVIGASSGIGEAVARELSNRGWAVGVAARRVEQLEALAADLGAEAHVQPMDLKNVDSARAGLASLIGKLGGMDLLLISAAMANPHSEHSWDMEKAQIDVNVTGFTALAFDGWNYFVEQGRGHLAAISSVAGLRGNRMNPMYSASKAYMFRYLESLRLRAIHEKLDIKVTDIRPGFIDTAMDGTKHIKEAKALRFIVLPPDKAATQICDALDKGKRTVYVPKIWKNVELPYQVIPDFLYEKL
jgi:short-subunit dehydrogenase